MLMRHRLQGMVPGGANAGCHVDRSGDQNHSEGDATHAARMTGRAAVGADQPSSAKSGRRNSSNVARSQLASVAGVTARTVAVRGTPTASETSPK